MPIIWRYRDAELRDDSDCMWNDAEGRTVRTPSGAVLPGPNFRGEQDVPDRWDQGRLTRFQYAGAWAHALIGFAYAFTVPKHVVYLDCSYAQLARLEGYNVPLSEGAMRPDIWNRTTHEIWEIKPTTALRTALRELDVYIYGLAERTPLRPGRSHIEGRAKLPGATGRSAAIAFDTRMPGTVRYTVHWNARG